MTNKTIAQAKDSGGGFTKIHVDVPRELLKDFRTLVVKNDKTMRSAVVEAFEQYLEKSA